MKSIIFNTEMVKAILDGRKIQTRKVIPYLEKTILNQDSFPFVYSGSGKYEMLTEYQAVNRISKYKVDDILYVKETFNLSGEEWGIANPLNIEYRADNTKSSHKWFSSNSMRMEYSRIFLKVTNVRVERLWDISVMGIEKETGWKSEIYSHSNANRAFYKDYCDFWDSNAKDGYKWEDNPYVFVYEFERINKEG